MTTDEFIERINELKEMHPLIGRAIMYYGDGSEIFEINDFTFDKKDNYIFFE